MFWFIFFFDNWLSCIYFVEFCPEFSFGYIERIEREDHLGVKVYNLHIIIHNHNRCFQWCRNSSILISILILTLLHNAKWIVKESLKFKSLETLSIASPKQTMVHCIFCIFHYCFFLLVVHRCMEHPFNKYSNIKGYIFKSLKITSIIWRYMYLQMD